MHKTIEWVLLNADSKKGRAQIMIKKNTEEQCF